MWRCWNCHCRSVCWDVLQRRITKCSKWSSNSGAALYYDAKYDYVIRMMPLPLLLEIRKAVICHCWSIWCWRCGVQIKKWSKQRAFVWQIGESPFFLLFLRGSGTHSTEDLILPCLKEPNKTVFYVWFYVLMSVSSKSMVFFLHQNKCRRALWVEVSSL
jgi:hypothetical protein